MNELQAIRLMRSNPDYAEYKDRAEAGTIKAYFLSVFAHDCTLAEYEAAERLNWDWIETRQLGQPTTPPLVCSLDRSLQRVEGEMNEEHLEVEMDQELIATIASQDPKEAGQRLDIILVDHGDFLEVIADDFSDGLYETRQAALDAIESSYRDGRFDLQWE